MNPRYRADGESFYIENYNQSDPFASFFPALAGYAGKPMWVFTANRGQCIASFGIDNKDGAFLEFQPANKAYQSLPLLGFRTFIKNEKGASYYEPFSPNNSESHQTMIVRPWELEIRDRNTKWGVEMKVVYFGIPNENNPVLLRQVTFKNIGSRSINYQFVDGLPRLCAYGMNDYVSKNMSRTIEAFAEVINFDQNVPIFKLKLEPADRPDVAWLENGFFSFALQSGKRLTAIVDPQVIFGVDSSLQIPNGFLERKNIGKSFQMTSNILPSGFYTGSLQLKPKDQTTVESFWGYSDSATGPEDFASRVAGDPQFSNQKRQEMENIYRTMVSRFGFWSGNEKLNAYANATFMDNVLRGGIPEKVSPKSPVVHFLSRKHGDMERDYNNFQVSATYYSQGNGNFRDVNQNRRNDILFEPNVGADNLSFFSNLIQLDGYNPLQIEATRFILPADIIAKLDIRITAESRKAFDSMRRRPVLAGEIYEFLRKYCTDPLAVENTFRMVMDSVKHEHSVKHGEGYWVDHWTYNLDHLDQFMAVYPEKINEIFFERKEFRFYDSDHVVVPRREKYQITPKGEFRQYGAVRINPEKEALLKSRKQEAHWVRTENGAGEIFETTLFIKLLGLLAIKTATLDPEGTGIEMEADKPGWCDALNGLPGLVGSSSHEMFELKRLVDTLLEKVVPIYGHKTIEIPIEIYGLLREIDMAFESRKADSDFRPTWDKLATARENFRQKTTLGVKGKYRAVRMVDLEKSLREIESVLSESVKKSIDPKTNLPTSYFIYSVNPADLHDGWRQYFAKIPFKQHRVNSFLEGPVHAMKLLGKSGALKLYQQVRKSPLRDRKLGLYKLNVDLRDEPQDLGRLRAFSPGWLENESVFLHMHYKFLLEILRAGLVEEFFQESKTGLIFNRDPNEYGRAPFENSSFIASSAFQNPHEHGRGFVARLSGATSEFMSMVYLVAFGREFLKSHSGEICFMPEPTLPKEWFSKLETDLNEKYTFTIKLFGVPVNFRNPNRKSTFGKGGGSIKGFEWIQDGRFHTASGKILPSEPTQLLRSGKLEKLDILIG